MMPSILLSACGREDAEYANGASESAVMGAILNLLLDYLQISGLQASVKPVQVPNHAVASIANRQRADLLFTLCSNHAPAGEEGTLQGTDICFSPVSRPGRRAAELLLPRLESIAPNGHGVALLPAPGLPDFRMAKCPAVQLRTGYRDNIDDAQWLTQSVGVISHALAKALTEWFHIPCKSPFSEVSATVRAPGGSLALRRAPHPEAALLLPLPNGSVLTLLHREDDWQYVEFEGRCGYVLRRFLVVKAP
ncbi:MAG: N-acetylmuramoyl-L-alanine amidase [Oscillospiraceae bacterium]|nr:N-acetylmuramoyl-L-alanine amidase [Oscillospiraceae bacterium]